MPERSLHIPDDPDALLRELAATADEQKRLTARLQQVKARRTDLVDAVRDRKLLTWRHMADMFGMTEAALQLASRVRKNR